MSQVNDQQRPERVPSSVSREASAGAEALLAKRYGADAVPQVALNDTIVRQLAHRSVRRFTDEPVTDQQVSAVIAAASSASTSSNMQWWSVVVVREPETKQRIRELSGGQRFVAEVPVFLVWLADLSRSFAIAERVDAPTAGSEYLETTLTAVIDTALAAQNAAVAAESLGLGITYVGGARNNPEQLAELLGLPSHVFAVFGMALGVPSPEEKAGIRPRLSQDVVVHNERYTPASFEQLEPMDRLLSDYFAQYGKSHDWFSSVRGRFSGPEGLSGRHRLREALNTLGFSTE